MTTLINQGVDTRISPFSLEIYDIQLKQDDNLDSSDFMQRLDQQGIQRRYDIGLYESKNLNNWQEKNIHYQILQQSGIDILYNNDRYELEYHPLSSLADHRIIRKNGKVIYYFTAPFSPDSPIKNFFVNESGWWLLYNDSYQIYSGNDISLMSTGMLIHNGTTINNQYDGSHILYLQTIQDKVFFFLEDRHKKVINYRYDGAIHQTPFSKIIHNECCEFTMLNIVPLIDGNNFFAQKKQGRFYVQMLLDK